ncbi:hypothetical protein M5K25_000682 [Dendrobium thyrsiflorum]|uniref:BED-type domain-containing protein n=1 Tax=Dendrobium thyrsiflorum TaxID=117978 RepID=A0ABD0W815_DENTH
MSPEPIVEDNISEEIILETADEVPSDSIEANVILTENDLMVEENKSLEENAIGISKHDEEVNPVAIKKRKKTSSVWDEFKEVKLANGQKKGECIHCKRALAIGSTGSTTQFRRHLDRCAARIRFIKNQKVLHFQPKDIDSIAENSQESASLTTFSYDNSKVRESIAHYILINEKPFSVVEEFGFNLVLKTMSPYFLKYSRTTARSDVLLVYEKEKKKLHNALKSINRISFTTDIWKSKNQRISYMVVTGHYVDSNWKLQKRVLSFLHLSPPHTATEIVDTFYKSLHEWNLENKVFTLSVDNASNNDRAIKLLKDNFRVRKKLFFGGKIFHVRCCAHILNLMVKNGIKSIEFVVEKIRDTVSFLNASEGRLLRFADVVHQLHLPTRKLIMDCATRWNSTYNMLTVALQLREAFTSYSEREVAYHNCPTEDEWKNIEKVCDVLGFFNEATNIISGTEYPTSNLFLSQICTIKKVLDDGSISSDEFVRNMTMKMKGKFDKYWGECNLLMAFGAIMDPRMKFIVIEFAYPMIYGEQSGQNISYVRTLLYELFEEYVTYCEEEAKGASDTYRLKKDASKVESSSKTIKEGGANKYSGWLDFTAYVSEKTSKKPAKSDLDNYLEDGLEICPPGKTFDVIGWWKNNQAKYRILSRLAVEILAIPISTVASESTFSAGERVVDTYRSKLGIETVQALICGSNWIRAHYGLKGRLKEEEDDDEIEIPIPST